MRCIDACDATIYIYPFRSPDTISLPVLSQFLETPQLAPLALLLPLVVAWESSDQVSDPKAAFTILALPLPACEINHSQQNTHIF